MTAADNARAFLASIGYRSPGDSTQDPRFIDQRDAIKAALNAIRDEANRAPAVPAPPAAALVKNPRRPEDVPSRGDRPGFQVPRPAPTPAPRRRKEA